MTTKSASAVVIGSGFGGLAAAIRLQVKGYQTTILEMRDMAGGRAYVFRDQGFVYDAGPTIITAPFLIDELFELAGRKTEDYVRIVPVTPFYRIVFYDGSTFDYTGDEKQMVEQIEKFNPDDVPGYLRFVDHSKRIFDRAFTDLADKPFSTIMDMVVVAPDLMRLRSDQSVLTMIKGFIKHPLLQQVFSFHPLLVGGNPVHASSIYSMIHFLERKWGVHFALGGTGALVQAMVKLFEELGGTVRLNTKVTQLLVENGEAVGVETGSGEKLPADVVVSNADVSNFYKKAVPKAARKKWTDERLNRMRYSMSLFLIYFGTNRTYPDLAHHMIILTERYTELLADIFARKVLAQDFSLYLHVPSRTDPSLAPPGGECFYVLSPVPHLGGKIDWANTKERYADAILASLEKLCPDLRKHVISKILWTPEDFETQLDSNLGSAFQFEPVLTQSAWFRPHNKSEDVKNFFLVGAGTHPGAGMPGVLSSAKLLERVLPAPAQFATKAA